MNLTFNLSGLNPLKGRALEIEATTDGARTFKVSRAPRTGLISAVEINSTTEKEELFASAKKQKKTITLFNSDGSPIGELISSFYRKAEFLTNNRRLTITPKKGTLMQEFIGDGFHCTQVGKVIQIELEDEDFLELGIIWGYSHVLWLMEC